MVSNSLPHYLLHIIRKARHQAKEARKRERREKAQSGEVDDDIDWSQAVGFAPPREESEEPMGDEESLDGDSGDAGDTEWRQAVSSSLPDNPTEEEAEPDISHGGGCDD